MENIAKQLTGNISHTVEMMAAVIIGIAILRVLYNYFTAIYSRQNQLSKEAIRLQFGSSVALALELLLGADVLATAVAPSWNDIGQLAAIATIRTLLNYFLGKELKNSKPAALSQKPDNE